MLCKYANKITKRVGQERTLVLKCAHSNCARFTQEVTTEACAKCTLYQIKEKLTKPCLPKLHKRAVTWAAAVADWTLNGSPVRTDEEVATIFTSYCNSNPPCPWFSETAKVCLGCGCNVNTGSFAILNKIKMATQHCPRGLW